MMRQSEFKRKYDPKLGKYTKQHIYGEGIIDTVKSFFKPTPKTSKPPPKKYDLTCQAHRLLIKKRVMK